MIANGVARRPLIDDLVERAIALGDAARLPTLGLADHAREHRSLDSPAEALHTWLVTSWSELARPVESCSLILASFHAVNVVTDGLTLELARPTLCLGTIGSDGLARLIERLALAAGALSGSRGRDERLVGASLRQGRRRAFAILVDYGALLLSDVRAERELLLFFQAFVLPTLLDELLFAHEHDQVAVVEALSIHLGDLARVHDAIHVPLTLHCELLLAG